MKNTIQIIGALVTIILSNYTYSQNIALNFDGSGDYIRTGFNGIPGNASRTVQCWFKGSPSSQQQFFVDMGNLSSGFGGRFSFKTNTNVLRIEIGGGGLNGVTNIRNNVWHQLTVTYDSAATTNKYKLYVDGVLDAQGNITAATLNSPASSTSPMTIGIRTDLNSSTDLLGNLDEVRIWSKVLTPAEITANYNSELCGTPAGLVAYYKMNEGIAGSTNTTITSLIDEITPTSTNTLSGFSKTGSTSNWVTGKTLSGGATIVNTNNISACGTYTMPDGRIITAAGTYYDTLPSSAPCDSLDKYTISFPPAIIRNTINDSGCVSYITAMGTIITTSGTYYDTLITSSACDTTIQYNIVISGAVDDSVYRVGARIRSHDTWAIHQWIRCDSSNLPISGATSSFIDVTTPGDYAVIITRGSCVDTSKCINFNPASIEEMKSNAFTIYPNPANNIINVSSINNSKILSVSVLDISGKLIFSNVNLKSNSIDIEELEKGVYLLKINSEEGIVIKKFVKK